MFLNVEQLEKQLDKEDSQEIGSMASFNVLETQFQMFITSRIYLDDEYVAMTRNYFLQYTQLAILEFRNTLIQHMEFVKKSIDEKGQHKREYDSWKAVRHNQNSRTQAPDQEMMHMLMMQISDPYMMKSQWLRISSKNMPRISSNDMVHNHYLEEAKKKTQECSRNSEPSLMPSARSQSTANGSKPKLRSNIQTSKNWPAFKNSFKCVFNANHAHCVTKFLNDVNSCPKVPSNKTTNRNKPVEQISVPNKQKRQIPIGHMFLIKKTFVVQKKTMTPRSRLRWKPIGRIFKTVGFRWVPTGKIFVSSTTKVDSEPPNGSNKDITNHNECEKTLDVIAGTLNGFKEFSTDEQVMTSDHNSSELKIHDYSNEQSSSKLFLKFVPPADKTATSRQKLKLLFHHHITMLKSTCKYFL
uniref:Integrase, catalytic region, zinc finger, CCHC-type, peptidase aspartic, catalytic n=1 Tax=Tanacetum cinerariifolium TaxID=118510 RepID=A0A6L2LZD7_TANCI|nr:hypothetical protein [Tanacetum cinerariifolium]